MIKNSCRYFAVLMKKERIFFKARNRGDRLLVFVSAFALATPISAQSPPSKKPAVSAPKSLKQDKSADKLKTREALPAVSASKPQAPAATPQAEQTPAPIVPAPIITKKPAPLPPVDTSKPPPMLPRASRAQMHGCADEWRAMKMAKSEGLPMWRQFAMQCLTRGQSPASNKK